MKILPKLSKYLNYLEFIRTQHIDNMTLGSRLRLWTHGSNVIETDKKADDKKQFYIKITIPINFQRLSMTPCNTGLR